MNGGAASSIISFANAELILAIFFAGELVFSIVYRLVIVENDQAQVGALLGLLEGFPGNDRFSVHHVANAMELEEHVKTKGQADVLLMDIDLGPEGPDGIETVRNCVFPGSGTQVVYVSGHVGYCTRVYQTEHAYFLTKPVSQSDFDDALNKVLENLEQVTKTPLGIRVGTRVVRVMPQNILYVESDRRKVRLFTRTGIVEAYGTLAEVAHDLPSNFVQCHKSFLVNLDCVEELRQDDLLLTTGCQVPMSQKRRKAVRDEFLARLRKRL